MQGCKLKWYLSFSRQDVARCEWNEIESCYSKFSTFRGHNIIIHHHHHHQPHHTDLACFNTCVWHALQIKLSYSSTKVLDVLFLTWSPYIRTTVRVWYAHCPYTYIHCTYNMELQWNAVWVSCCPRGSEKQLYSWCTNVQCRKSKHHFLLVGKYLHTQHSTTQNLHNSDCLLCPAPPPAYCPVMAKIIHFVFLRTENILEPAPE